MTDGMMAGMIDRMMAGMIDGWNDFWNDGEIIECIIDLMTLCI